MFKFKAQNKKKGFTLVEVLVGTALFAVVALASYNAFTSLYRLISLSQYKIAGINLLNEQIEIARNLPYSSVGIDGGYPPGEIAQNQTITRNGIEFQVETIVRNLDLPFDGTIGSTTNNDLSPADNKLVEITVSCAACQSFSPVSLTTNIAPKNLETASTNGALFIRASDSNGQPIAGAEVHVENNQVSPAFVIDDTTNVNGVLQLVDVPPGVEAYEITVTKPGYSTDRTYPTGGNGNPNPSKPHATVVLQQVTQMTFLIDRLSTLTISTMTDTCTPAPNIHFDMTGSKTIGPGVPKYSQSLMTDNSGRLTLNSVEWDSYSMEVKETSYASIGFNPLNPISVNPNSTQKMSLVVAHKDASMLMVVVKDSVTQLPITDALVALTEGGETAYRTTERGYINQTDWSGGAGQAYYTNDNMYFADDSNIESNLPAGDLKLKQAFGQYIASAILESSTFDTGSTSNFHNLIWQPIDQPVGAGANSVKFQLASNLTVDQNSTWTYTGPDGTNGTYYTYPYDNIYSGHDGKRYLRYKLFLSTADPNLTPNVSDVAFTFTSACTPPGQVYYADLDHGTYSLSVGKAGYATTTVDVTIDDVWKAQEILLTTSP